MGVPDGNEQTVRVLLVDDNELNREMEAAMLEPYGFQVVEAEGGKQAVELVQDVTFDVVFLDYLMPEMDGLETAEQICSVCKPTGKTPVLIALTAEESGEVADAFRAKGCQDLLTKPIDGEKLDGVLERWCGVHPHEVEQQRPTGMTEEEAASIQIPGIDMAASQTARSKTKEQYLDLLSLYYEDGMKQVELWQSVSESGLKDYRIWVHALKSASANIGATALSEEARAQEMAAKDGDWLQVQSGFPPLMEHYRVLLDNIGARLSQLRARPEQEQVTQPPLDADTLKQRLQQALEQLEDFRPEDCAQSIQGLLQHPLPENIRALLHETQNKLRMYQDDDGETILRRAIHEVDQN
jgi:CheY-like chemotaxis protein